jgi:hypothetical protein
MTEARPRWTESLCSDDSFGRYTIAVLSTNAAMPLTSNTRQLLHAYDSFTNVAGGPDLPWVLEVYETLDDITALFMIRALCYAWAAGQYASGYYTGSVDRLADSLVAALPEWFEHKTRDEQLAALRKMGVNTLFPAPEPRPAPATVPPREHDSAGDDKDALQDMRSYFHIGLSEATLLYRLGRTLKSVNGQDQSTDKDPLDREAIADMSAYFQIGWLDAVLLYRLGLRLKSNKAEAVHQS